MLSIKELRELIESSRNELETLLNQPSSLAKTQRMMELHGHIMIVQALLIQALTEKVNEYEAA